MFSGEDGEKKGGALSGGEAARLLFCRIMVLRPNVLVLDEPTNHLDLEAIHGLVAALRSFEGSIVFVSHDRAFVSALATRILEVTARGFRDFPGTYNEYLSKQGDDHLDAEAVVLRAKNEQAAAAPAKARSAALSWEEDKRKKNRRKQLPSLRDAAVLAIDAAEAEKASIQARFCEPGFFERSKPDEVSRLQAEEKSLESRITELVADWEALEREIEAMGAEAPTESAS